MSLAAVLFDLDGTLVDTAPDLVGALNRLLVERRRPQIPYAVARNEASNGALGLIRLAFGTVEPELERESLRQRFLEIYTENVCKKSRVFIELSELSDKLPQVPWGIVTNKPQALTVALLEQLGLAGLPGSVVGGDRLPQRKPDPAPLLFAAAELGATPARCIYVGDAPRDVAAGKAAGMATVAAAYGYVRPSDDVALWGADAVATHPQQVVAAVAAVAARWPG